MSETHSSLEGVIKSKPEDWEERRLGDLFKQRKEKNRPDLPLLAVTGAGGVVPRDSLERRDTSNADKSKYLRVCEGDIAYNTMRMWQGVSGLSPHEGIVSPAYTICQPVNDVSSSYMSQLFKLPELIQVFHRNSQGLVDDTLNLKFENFSPIRIPVPPLPEQQKIAAILSSVDDVIEKKRAQIDKLKDLKTGMMQELLTKGIGHTAFKDSPVGRIPEGWPHFELRDLTLVITKGTTPTTGGDSYTDSGINFIKVECINKSGFVDSKKFSFIDSETHRKLSRSILHEGDILITIAGATVGKLAIVKKEHLPANTNQALAIVRVDESKVLRDFVYYWLQSGYIKSSIDGVQTVGAQPNLSLSQIGDFNIFLPGIEEQKAIVSSLSSLDLLIAGAQRKMSAVEYLKKSLMQDLLTGKVRVNVDNKENAVA